MDQKKSESPPLKNLLSTKMASTPFGYACTEMEVCCVACTKIDLIVVPDRFIEMIDCVEAAGTFWVEQLAKEAGWVMQTVKRKDGMPSFYMLCPDCVETAFRNYHPPNP